MKGAEGRSCVRAGERNANVAVCMTDYLQIDNLSKRFGHGRSAFERIYFTVAKGDFIALIAHPARQVHIAPYRRRSVGSQRRNRPAQERRGDRARAATRCSCFSNTQVNFPWKTVLGNVMLGIKYQPGLAAARSRVFAVSS